MESIAKEVKGDIMNLKGAENMSLEYQRYGRNKETVINNTYIDSGEYRNKFNHITDNDDVNRVIYSKAKEMLKHRSGTKFEDMYWIDKTTGAVVASVLNEQQEERIIYTESVLKAISGQKNLIAMHTHPNSMPPSAADFNSAFYNEYAASFVFCHDGKIFGYTSNKILSTYVYERYISEFKAIGLQEYEAQIKALDKLRQNYEIDFWEVK